MKSRTNRQSNPRRCSQTAALIFLALACAVPFNGWAQSQAGQSRGGGPPSPRTAYLLTFEITTAIGRLGGASDDQITIVFSDRSAETTIPPDPLFGLDMVAEFSFSGFDARPPKTLVFQRGVNSIDFLSSRYIRVINHGNDAWAGETLSISYQEGGGKVQTLLLKQSLYPRSGASREGGLENFNRRQWSQRVYWEGELQRLRRDRPYFDTEQFLLRIPKK